MAIIKTVYDDYEFWQWLKQSDNYKNNFGIYGACALQQYLDNLSDELGENIEFDPIAWCCEFSEYTNIEDYNEQHNQDIKNINELEDKTTVIEFEGGFIIQDF